MKKRFSHGIQALTSYTWSHEIDDGQGGGSSAIFFSGLFSTYNGNNTFERGSGTLDQRHRLVQSFVWVPTLTHSTSPFAKYVLNNWQLSGIATLASGRPTGSPTIRVVSAETASGTLLSTSYIEGIAGSSRVPFLPVNSIYTPASYRADLRLSKTLPFNIHDRDVRLQLNFEVFNVSNSWSPTSLATQEYTATKGVLTPTLTRRVMRRPMAAFRMALRRGAADQRPPSVLTRSRVKAGRAFCTECPALSFLPV